MRLAAGVAAIGLMCLPGALSAQTSSSASDPTVLPQGSWTVV